MEEKKIAPPTKEEVEGMRETLMVFGGYSEQFCNRLTDREVEGYYKRHMQQEE